MSLLDKLKGELVDVIAWTDDTPDTMVWRFPRYHDQIKLGARLTVRESQVAVFVEEGVIADVFEPGMHTLETRNLPLLSTLLGWKHGFDSPFRAEVYFVNTKQFTDLKWGTRNPVIVRDPELGPVRLRAFGTYVIRVHDAAALVREVSGTASRFTVDGISEQLRNLIVTRFSEHVAEAGIPVLDLATRYGELSADLVARLAGELAEYGLELTKLLVENVSLPEEVERALDKRGSMGVVGDLDRFVKYQTGAAMEAAASNPAGGGAAGVGMGMGLGMAAPLGQVFARPEAGPQPAVAPGASGYYVARDGERRGPFGLAALADMVRAGEVTTTTLLWTAGMSEWKPAGSFRELEPLLATVPPPLPG